MTTLHKTLIIMAITLLHGSLWAQTPQDEFCTKMENLCGKTFKAAEVIAPQGDPFSATRKSWCTLAYVPASTKWPTFT